MPRASRTLPIVVPILPAPRSRCRRSSARARASLLHVRADSGDAITTTRSAGRIFTSPRGRPGDRGESAQRPLIRVVAPPAQRATDDRVPRSIRWERRTRRPAPCPRRRRPSGGPPAADDARDGVGGLELRRDHAVDIDLAFTPGVEKFRARGAHDRLGLGEPLGQDRANQVGLLARAAGNEQICLLDARLADDRAGRPVALHGSDVVARRTQRGDRDRRR